MPRVDSLPPAYQREVNALVAAWRNSPDDLVKTSDGFWLSFDTWCFMINSFTLRPRPASLAVHHRLREIRHEKTATGR